MATKTLYLLDTRVATGTNNLYNTQEGGTAPTDAAHATATGWVAATVAATNTARLASLAEIARTDAEWSTTAKPVGAPDVARGDAWRAGPYTGRFAATAWALSLAVRSITAAYAGRFRFRWRVWKSANADGSGAAELTGATQVTAATAANLSTTANTTLSVSWSPGATITLNNEYLFFQLALEITTAGTATTQDINLRKNSASAVTTPDFLVQGADTGVRVSFPAPPAALATGAGLQEFRSLVRAKKAAGADDPLARLELYETGVANGSPLATPLADTPISSTTGTVISGSWDASALGTPSGAAVEARVVGTGGAGSSLEVYAPTPVEWDPTTSTAAAPLTATVTDAVAAIDAQTRRTARSLTDAAAVVDAPARRSARTLTETVALNDAAAASKARTMADAVALADPLTRLFARTSTDAMAVADGYAKIQAFARSQTDALAATDALAKTYGKTTTDSLAASDSVAALGAVIRSLSDTIAVSDSLARASNRTLTDAALVSDAMLRRFARTLTEAAPLADIVTRLSTRVLVDAVVVSDAVSVQAAGVIRKTLADAIAVSDAYAKLQAYRVAVVDALVLSDAVSVQAAGVIRRTVSDAVTVADALALALAARRALTDAVAAADALLRARARPVIDAVAVADAATRALAYAATATDAVALADGYAKVQAYRRAPTETVPLADAVLLGYGARSLLITDPVSVNDAPVARLADVGLGLTPAGRVLVVRQPSRTAKATRSDRTLTVNR